MSTVSITLSEPVLRRFEDFAEAENRELGDVLREVLESHVPNVASGKPSIRDFKPLQLGGVLKPLAEDDDLLEEMLHG